MKRFLKIVGLFVLVLLVLGVVGSIMKPAHGPNAATMSPGEDQAIAATLPSPTVAATPDPPMPTKAPHIKPAKVPRVKPTAAPQPTAVPVALDPRCESVSPALVTSLDDSLTVTGGGSLRAAQAVRSHDFEKVWFVAADIQGPSMDGPDEIGVWATNIDPADTAPGGMIYPADAFAHEFSDWAQPPSVSFSPTDDGFDLAQSCTAAILASD